MSDLSTALEEGVAPQPEPETDDTEAEAKAPVETGEETPIEPEADDEGTSEADGEEGEAEGEESDEPEYYELDFGGNKFAVEKNRLDPEVAEKVQEFGANLWSDYTRKSQEVAEQTKGLEAKQEAVQKLMSLQNETLDTYASGLALRKEIEQLSQVDMNRLWQSNPDRARQLSDALGQKQAQFQQVVAQVSQMENQVQQEQQQYTQKQRDEGRAKILKVIPSFEKEAEKVVDYVVKTYGVPREQAQQWDTNPNAAQMAYKAMRYDQLIAKAKKPGSNTPRAENTETPTPPRRTARGSGSSAKLDLNRDAGKMSSEEWLRRRNAQLREKAKAR